MKINLRMLGYVEAAARHGNVSEAARQLNVSQSSVSAAIAQFEEIIGTAVFVRHHARGISVTSAGETLLRDARQLLKFAQDFEENALSLSDGMRGHVIVGCFLTLASRYMPKLLADFSRRYPGIDVTLEEGDQDEIVQMILSGRVEIAISYHSALRPEIASKFLGELPPHVLLPVGHRLARRQSIGLKELANDPFLLLNRPFSRDYFLNLFRLVEVEPLIAYQSRSHDFIRGLVAHGHGYTIHNAISRNNFAPDGTPVVAIPIDERLPGARLTCLWLKQHQLRPVVQVFERFLTEAFAPDGLLEARLRVS